MQTDWLLVYFLGYGSSGIYIQKFFYGQYLFCFNVLTYGKVRTVLETKKVKWHNKSGHLKW